MAGPYPLATLAAQVTDTGISAPTFEDVLASLQATYQSIFGSDAVLDNSSQDGQWIGAIAAAINDSNATAVAVFSAYSPATAQGGGLSSVVKINGIERQVATNSQAPMLLVGQTGRTIVAGLVGDLFGNQWALPANLTFPASGNLVCTATCTTAGNITAAPGTITNILNPTQGWNSASNTGSAVVGVGVEDDATLRQRQAASTSIPAISVLGSIIGSIANLTGVQNYAGYENDTGVTNSLGIPGHSISVVVNGGNITAVADVIAELKTPGTGTYGNTSVTVVDALGVPNTINFFEAQQVRVLATINLNPLTNFQISTVTAIQQTLANFVNGLEIGQSVPWYEAVSAANLGAPLNATYSIANLTLGGANLFEWSNDETQSPWTTNGSVTISGGPAGPFIGTTGQTMTATPGGLNHGTQQVVNVSAAGEWTVSLFYMANTVSYVSMELSNPGGTIALYCLGFHLSGAGTVGAISEAGGASGVAASITALGNGWYRCTLSGTLPGVTQPTLTSLVCNASGTTGYSAAGTESVYVYGAQFEEGPAASGYDETQAGGGGQAQADLDIDFNEIATMAVGDVLVNVL